MKYGENLLKVFQTSNLNVLLILWTKYINQSIENVYIANNNLKYLMFSDILQISVHIN